jgi:hypothetical protein
VPDHTTLSRRSSTLAVPRPQLSNIGDADNAQPPNLLVDSTGLKLCGAGEWLVEKHGTRLRIPGSCRPRFREIVARGSGLNSPGIPI